MVSKEDSLYKCCQKAVDQAIAEDKTSIGYFTIDRAMKNLLNITTPKEWKKDFLFNIVARAYMATYAAEIEYRSGIPSKGVYFTSDTAHEFISKGLVMNAQDLADAYTKVASDLAENHAIRFTKNGIDGQIAFDEESNVYQEASLRALVEAIKQSEKGG